MPDPILTPDEWRNWHAAKKSGDTETLIAMMTLLGRGGRWAALAALTNDSWFRVDWQVHRVAYDRYEVTGPGVVTATRIRLGVGASEAEALARAEEYVQQREELIPPHLR